MRSPCSPSTLSSSLLGSYSLVVSSFVSPLIVVSVFLLTVGPQLSSWSSFPSPVTWRFGYFSCSHSRAFLSEETPSNCTFANDSCRNDIETKETFQQRQGQVISRVNDPKDVTLGAKRRDMKRDGKLEKREVSLARVRSSIRKAAQIRNFTSVHEDPDYVPQGPIYRNPNAFHRSYLEMERLFKIYIYEEGEPPLFHDGPCKSIYSSEGRLIHELEKGKLYRTKNPDEALVYFLPFSVVNLVEHLYAPGSHEINAIGRMVVDYVNVISSKHPFWNRSLGADHFMLSCHDWGPRTSSYVPDLFRNSIRVLCNANTSEGFNPRKDASFPEIHLRTGDITGLVGGPSPSKRPFLAFFAGRLHGHIRHLLLERWKDKDQDVQVYNQLPNGISYDYMLKRSRFCLCPSGYEVASPRVVEAIYSECVPVLISEGYVPPFSDVLNWKAFSVHVEVKDIPRIKEILMDISQRQYLRLQRRVKQVQRHFVVNGPSKRFDMFHMTMHSIWLRRLNVHI
ncbi:hypothetical protein K2173_018396 [Erythroxylum novogranatense]|uniref:Exostosin GT47 domain-containing protein n=1 Tax=Erythroxylum novogranatense TaxID=1862640 RepID=A0AAV8UDW2_9ROSI|nr:hypothetical protein K2173_018396 [Erythroxylum novogranatense]